MKRLSLAIMFVFCTLAMAAQDGIKVKFQGASPDIMDFAWSYVTSSDGDEDEEVDESTNVSATGSGTLSQGPVSARGLYGNRRPEGRLHPRGVSSRRFHKQVGNVLLEHER